MWQTSSGSPWPGLHATLLLKDGNIVIAEISAVEVPHFPVSANSLFFKVHGPWDLGVTGDFFKHDFGALAITKPPLHPRHVV